MFVLDSDVLNIISGDHRDSNVMEWFDGLDETQIYLSVIAILEKAKAAARAAKKGKGAAASRANETLAILKENFAGRILALDAEAAEDLGRMLGEKEKHANDAAVAAIAKRHKFAVVTRNVADYAGRGADLLNPFEKPPATIKSSAA